MTLGQRLQKARKEAGLSQEDLAEQLGVSRQAVSKWDAVLKQLRVEFSENKRKYQIMLIGGVFIFLTGCMLFPELGEVIFPNGQYMYIWSALGDVLTGIGGCIAIYALGIWRAYKVLTMNEEFRKGKDKK